MCEDRLVFVWVNPHVCLCGQQHPKCEWAISLVYQNFFCKLIASSNPTNKNLKHQRRWRFNQLCLCNLSELGTCSCEIFFSQWQTLSPPGIFNFAPDSLCSIIVNYCGALCILLNSKYCKTPQNVQCMLSSTHFRYCTYSADVAVRRPATSAPHTRPTQRLSRPPPIQKLGAENRTLQLNI